MSDHYMQAQGSFTSGEEQNLFKMSLTTVWRCQWFTEPDSSKWSSSESSTFKSQLESGLLLNQFNSLFTSMFDDLNSQFSFKFALKLKFSMTVTQSDDSASQENIESSIFNNQTQSEFQNISVDKQIELAKLRVQQLQLELQIKRLAADLNSISDSFQLSTLLVQFIWFDDKINNYRKEVTFKNSRLHSS